MFKPYIGTKNTGIPFWDQEELNQTVALYDKLGFQLLLHAIGDRAVSDTLDALEYARATNGTSGRRHRIEHAEVTRLGASARSSARSWPTSPTSSRLARPTSPRA
jgi:predicted amidohydrolase YtcJ